MGVETQTKNKSSSIKEFESLLNEDFKDRKLKENQIIKATVTEITKNFIVVDCKAKMEGMIPVEEFKNNNELEKIKIGSVIEVYLERIESFKGEIIISREKARRMAAWEKLKAKFETGEEFTGIIVGRIKGGYQCNVDGLPTFMPASQIDLRPLKKVDHLMNTPIKVIATRIDTQRGNICTSRRQVLEKSKNAEVKEALKNIKEGDIIENARVKGTTDFGIFLEINGLDAMCHVSDISYGRVKKPSDLVTVGQQLKVRITKIDPVTNRVSASVKALTDDPYENIEKKYKVGDFPFKALGRSRVSGDLDGFVKVLADEISDEILGVHMIGPRVADLISEAVVAMEYRASAEDIARICHAHPTFSEAIKEAALNASEKRALHI